MSAIEDLFNMLELGNQVTIINAINLLRKKQEDPESVTVEKWDYIYRYGDPEEREKLLKEERGIILFRVPGPEE